MFSASRLYAAIFRYRFLAVVAPLRYYISTALIPKSVVLSRIIRQNISQPEWSLASFCTSLNFHGPGLA
jgi:hypothetical protein